MFHDDVFVNHLAIHEQLLKFVAPFLFFDIQTGIKLIKHDDLSPEHIYFGLDIPVLTHKGVQLLLHVCQFFIHQSNLSLQLLRVVHVDVFSVTYFVLLFFHVGQVRIYLRLYYPFFRSLLLTNLFSAMFNLLLHLLYLSLQSVQLSGFFFTLFHVNQTSCFVAHDF